jgi:hypothetical protein
MSVSEIASPPIPPAAPDGAPSPPLTWAECVLFLSVASLALWVGVWGAFYPRHVDWALPWLVPALHARFLGAMYLSGFVFMAGAALARRWYEVRVVVPMCAVWTGLLLLVSLLYLPEFDWRKPQVPVWFGAYTLFPAGCVAVFWARRRDRTPGPGSPVPPLLRAYLRVQGVVVLTLGLALLLFPAAVATVWPWAVTTLLAQLYSAPFSSYGLGALLAAREPTLPGVRLYLLGTLAFGAGVLLASAQHLALFSSAHVSDWLWFGAFGVATVALAAGAVLAFRPQSRGARSGAPGSLQHVQGS